MNKKELYHVNHTMKLLGKQHYMDILSDDKFATITDVIKAHRKCSVRNNGLVATIYEECGCNEIIWDIFVLGFIWGKRAERKKHK